MIRTDQIYHSQLSDEKLEIISVCFYASVSLLYANFPDNVHSLLTVTKMDFSPLNFTPSWKKQKDHLKRLFFEVQNLLSLENI